MGIIYRTVRVPSLYAYEREYNEDGSEKHIVCEGARFHVISWDSQGEHCSEPNCEVNKRRQPVGRGDGRG
jgi:hypothetical protein